MPVAPINTNDLESFKILQFVDSWFDLFDDEDRDLAPYLLRLAIRLYMAHQSGKTIHKMDACRFIPGVHAMAAKRYIHAAK